MSGWVALTISMVALIVSIATLLQMDHVWDECLAKRRPTGVGNADGKRDSRCEQTDD